MVFGPKTVFTVFITGLIIGAILMLILQRTFIHVRL